MSIPRSLAMITGVALIAVAAGCGARSTDVAVPRGEGWHCFRPHPDASRATSCMRTRDACVRAVADAMESARREGEVVAYSSCEAQREAWCVRVSTSGDVACMARREDCEALRVGTLGDDTPACRATR